MHSYDYITVEESSSPPKESECCQCDSRNGAPEATRCSAFRLRFIYRTERKVSSVLYLLDLSHQCVVTLETRLTCFPVPP